MKSRPSKLEREIEKWKASRAAYNAAFEEIAVEVREEWQRQKGPARVAQRRELVR